MATADPRTLAETARAALGAASPSVVRIGRPPGRGCGVVVDDGFVLTNAHNLRDRTTEVTFADGRAEQGRVAAVDPDGDLVVLEVDTANAPGLPWAERAAEPGDVVFAVGRTADGGARITSGMVSGVERSFRGPRGRRITGSLEHTAPLARGSSGSPLVDADGRLLGVNTARLADGFYLALPADHELRARVDALVRGESVHRLVLGVGLAPADVARQLRASVGLADRDGLLVRSVAPESAAERAGIRVGDLITQAGGSGVATVDDLHDALDRARADAQVTLHVVRGSDELDVDVSFTEPGGPAEG
jgi:serine protease Do